MTKFLSDADLKRVRKAVRGVRGTEHLPADATPLERAKYGLCKEFLVYMRKRDMTQRELARILGIPESRVSEIAHYRVDKLTLDRLVRYYACLKPDAVFKIA